ncbi:MAG: M15 family metallopeptidase [bacterium]
MKKQIFITAFILITGFIFGQNDTSIVFLKNLDSTIVFDVKYATKDNFTKQVLYPTGNVYIRKVVGEKLVLANKYLKEKYNLKIKVYDAYRPLSVQKIMWKIMPDNRYVADPKKGSRHNRGAAVDLTLIDENGQELDMGTPYDDFTQKAHSTYKDLPADVLKNRTILQETMKKFGFEEIESEWWHYDFKGWSKFAVLDVEIK